MTTAALSLNDTLDLIFDAPEKHLSIVADIMLGNGRKTDDVTENEPGVVLDVTEGLPTPPAEIGDLERKVETVMTAAAKVTFMTCLSVNIFTATAPFIALLS